ncbi:MAG: hypothetical protein H6612_02080 [Ignavibacteriales bacterium]|nr:hypothetical protein [Ignavibacteriales bacterium]
MDKKTNKHTFHIPVMGTGFTIDTPVKVAKYGISSVVSLVDDILAENMREYYSKKLGLPFKSISDKIEDFRAKRFTEYLNLMDKIVKEKYDELLDSYHKNVDELHKYFEMLPNAASLKEEFNKMIEDSTLYKKLRNWLDEHLNPGSIDVNIMTKLDKENYRENEKLPHEFNDAHASLRGFANSNLESSLILSAGMNPRLYSYLEKFDDFYPDENGNIKKKIVIKVSDYRSALIQGKFLAKKGLWVSEYRIESGLNCGGHAFATDGFLMGPILEEFKNKRNELTETVYKIFVEGLQSKNKLVPNSKLTQLITAQGGVGTTSEHNFLMEHYNLDSIGWGTPFLLVPEATNVDEETLELLCNAKEKDLYLSGISPLGVPFNAVKGNSQEVDKKILDNKGRPGSACPKKFLTFNTEFTERVICTASRQYQSLKISELDSKKIDLAEYQKEKEKIVEKECLCIGLANSTRHLHGIDNNIRSEGVSVCPGPNLAYFDKVLSLKQMVDHIYGRINVITRTDRPNLFMKELNLYYDYLKNKIEEVETPFSEKQIAYFNKFVDNLNEGIGYYKNLFEDVKHKFEDVREDFLVELENIEFELANLIKPVQLVKVS